MNNGTYLPKALPNIFLHPVQPRFYAHNPPPQLNHTHYPPTHPALFSGRGPLPNKANDSSARRTTLPSATGHPAPNKPPGVGRHPRLFRTATPLPVTTASSVDVAGLRMVPSPLAVLSLARSALMTCLRLGRTLSSPLTNGGEGWGRQWIAVTNRLSLPDRSAAWETENVLTIQLDTDAGDLF